MAWKKELGEQFSMDIFEYGSHHKKLYRCTNVAKYRSFQYRTIQRGLVTNIQLFKWKMADSEMCSKCNSCKESISHMLVTCPKADAIWQRVKGYMSKNFPQVSTTWTTVDILFNTVAQRTDHVINLLVLITKQYIYRQKCLSKEILFNEVQREFVNVQRLEKYIAVKNDHFCKYAKKWCVLSKEKYVINSSYNDGIDEYVYEM